MTRVKQRILFVNFCVMPPITLKRSDCVIAAIFNALVDFLFVNLHIVTLQITLFNTSVGAFAALKRSLFDMSISNMCRQLSGSIRRHITKRTLETVDVVEKMLAKDILRSKHLEALSALEFLSIVRFLSPTMIVEDRFCSKECSTSVAAYGFHFNVCFNVIFVCGHYFVRFTATIPMANHCSFGSWSFRSHVVFEFGVTSDVFVESSNRLECQIAIRPQTLEVI